VINYVRPDDAVGIAVFRPAAAQPRSPLSEITLGLYQPPCRRRELGGGKHGAACAALAFPNLSCIVLMVMRGV